MYYIGLDLGLVPTRDTWGSGLANKNLKSSFGQFAFTKASSSQVIGYWNLSLFLHMSLEEEGGVRFTHV